MRPHSALGYPPPASKAILPFQPGSVPHADNTLGTNINRGTTFGAGQGSTSMELLFDSRRYNPLRVDEYFADSPLPIALELGETRGSSSVRSNE